MWEHQPFRVVPPPIWKKRRKSWDDDKCGSTHTLSGSCLGQADLRREMWEQLERSQHRKKLSHKKMKPSAALRRRKSIRL
jgi:hypothetical protein